VAFRHLYGAEICPLVPEAAFLRRGRKEAMSGKTHGPRGLFASLVLSHKR